MTETASQMTEFLPVILPLVWAAILALAVFLYVLLGGYDLGLGVLFPLAPSHKDRDAMMASVAPFWDGNETWLVLGGGGLLAAFPLAYSIMLPALYIPIMLMLIGLILRGVAFEFRFKSSPLPFIAVDQEGGVVQRLAPENGHSSFPSARSVGANPSFASPEAAERLYAAMAEELAGAGFNLNFGPVVDLSLNPNNYVIVQRNRSFGADPNTVAALAGAFIRAHRAAGVATTAKHFPGHGSSTADSHKILADISETWQEIEIEPYRTLAKDGLLDAVMVGHLYHPRFSDGAKAPASLSGRAIAALRDKGQIGFKGVVVSDDLEMGAVRDDYSLEERVVKAVNAGTDLLVFSNVKERDPELGTRLHGVIADAVRTGRISRSRIEKAYGKISLLKRRIAGRDLPGKW
jgi:beta-N-acetylhexosaminidase